MLLKLLGGSLVIISSSMIGFIVAGYYKQRPEILRNLQGALSMLETEINYAHTPLPEALKNVGKRCEKEVSELFIKTMRHLTKNEGLTAGESWEKALNEFSKKTSLKENEIEILTSFGKYLGISDKDDQIKNIKLTIANLKQQEALAIEERQKNERLYKYLGVLVGLAIFLLLF